VLLPPLAGAAGGAGASTAETSVDMAGVLTLTLGKVLLFVVLVLAVGRRAVPWVLVRAARTGSRELFTLAVLAAALGIAYGSAALFGVSFALGAFFAGVVLSETDLSHQAAANSLPLRDAFAVLFFVSVGMLFDPTILLREPLRVAAVLLVIVVLKSLPAFVILLAFGQPVGAALRVSAGLAQIGEFSFILAAFGVASGLLPPEGRDLILAGALLSITINPLAFGAAERVFRQLKRRPALVAWLGRSERTPRDKHARPKAPRWRDHAVLVGFGRVGSTIGQILGQLDLPFVVIEQDHRLVEELRRRGLAVVWGDAGAPGVLAAARVRRARLLVVTTPDRLQTRRILEQARDANPGIDTVVRVHSQGELAYLERQGVGLAVMGERELALGMMDYALRSLGLREAEARLMVRAFRTSGDARTFERDDEGRQRAAPELRQHPDRTDEATPG
jgi:CPA2 family monovalent cation:H+ antiporter-2